MHRMQHTYDNDPYLATVVARNTFSWHYLSVGYAVSSISVDPIWFISMVYQYGLSVCVTLEYVKTEELYVDE